MASSSLFCPKCGTLMRPGAGCPRCDRAPIPSWEVLEQEETGEGFEGY